MIIRSVGKRNEDGGPSECGQFGQTNYASAKAGICGFTMSLAREVAARGITVNTVHGNPRSIAAVAERFKPHVESMEGAAFMYACLIHGLVFAQVRAVSNVVEKRNRSAWKMAEAIGSLGNTALNIIEEA